MLIFLVPVVIGFLAMSLAAIGDKLRTGKQVGTGKQVTKFERWCFKNIVSLNVVTFFSFAISVIMLAALICGHIHYAPFPTEYKAVTMTLDTSRSDSNMDIERAAAIHKVMDMNRELATIKYWDDSIWVGWFYPDRVAKLEFIK